MKVDKRILDVTSTLAGEKIAMGIDTSALSHIMSVLTDLYSDPEAAIIREYATNAFDAHVEAKQTRPIEVTLPTPLSPYFTVQDFGVGLGVDDIRDIYSRYGTSTKRDSNDVVGMLGLGCKSALTYTNQFTLSSVKNGRCVQVSISRDEDGAGSMTIVADYETDHPNGTTVIVPAKTGNLLEAKAHNFFRFWTNGTVLVNGEEPKKVDGLWVAPNILLTTEVAVDMIVMGNIAYPTSGANAVKTPVNTFNAYNPAYKTVYFVAIGDVQFTPSREALQMTAKTKDALAAWTTAAESAKQTTFSRMVSEAKTPWDAIQVYREIKKYGYQGTPDYNGKPLVLTFKGDEYEFPSSVEGRPPIKGNLDFLYVDTRGKQPVGNGKTWDHRQQVSLANDRYYSKIGWFTNFTGADFTSYKRQKLYIWMKQKGLVADDGAPKIQIWYLVGTMPKSTNGWVDPSTIFDWNEVEAIKVPKDTRSDRLDGRPTGAYNGWIPNPALSTNRNLSSHTPHRAILAATIDTSKPLFWLNGNTWNNFPSREVSLLRNTFPTCTIVALEAGRVNKFQRDFPMAVACREQIRKMMDDWIKTLTNNERIALSLADTRIPMTMARINPDEIRDPEIRNLINICRINIMALKDNVVKFKPFGLALDPPEWKNPMTKYPLIAVGSTDPNILKHIPIYINAAFKKEVS